MSDQELVQVLDYILNRCDEASIEVVAEAVTRRRRDIAMFGSRGLPDPKQWAQGLSAQVNIGATIDGLRDTIRDMAVRIIRQEAPELTDEQVDALTGAWVPSSAQASGDGESRKNSLPREVLTGMIEQFVVFSQGRMGESEDRKLREEMGSWPERYWNAFPQVIQLIITDYLNGEIGEAEFNSKIGTALAMYN
ncbi:hypothetical protein [Breznakiella homolactica]|uniref:Uncharacterized protein n=1 Tax=Breznakiella homolactica TaxID=2798577 RepID=A0A7T7XMZ2_9SPIR|nr:hypothetical protein [Breznakiella homolactica]QQO09310.1 hypothetical protein JFL75_20665 [Breznakiella homolactica]